MPNGTLFAHSHHWSKASFIEDDEDRSRSLLLHGTAGRSSVALFLRCASRTGALSARVFGTAGRTLFHLRGFALFHFRAGGGVLIHAARGSGGIARRAVVRPHHALTWLGERHGARQHEYGD